MKIAFIGGGNMGEAMLATMMGKKLAVAGDITVSDVSETRRVYLSQKYGVKTLADNRQTVTGQDVVVFAIKPQMLAAVMAELKGRLKPEQLALSIIAGARIDTIRQGLNHKSIVRSMPNTPAQIGEGVTVWTATAEVTEPQKKSAGKILGAMGKEFYAGDESFLDMATAVSGSGPAYLFYYVESMIAAGIKIGFSPEMAKELVIGTVLGVAHLIQQSGKEPAELRRMVTSPGGTTAEAIRKFEESGFTDLIYQAVKAAYEKAKQLGGQK
ncbi:MAG: pyrroline-5-carboxylate reductase [Dehalococcoidales bacterium]|nr:pyrroline-5-carboxylate reductase [Dehalococcoidales bacterium]